MSNAKTAVRKKAESKRGRTTGKAKSFKATDSAEAFRMRITARCVRDAEIARLTEIKIDPKPYSRLLREGEYFSGSHGVARHPAVRAHFRKTPAEMKECYANCQLFILDDADGVAVYHEGYVTSSVQGILLHHAWLVVGGAVVDPTLDAVASMGLIGADEARSYFGIPFTRMQVCQYLARTSVHGPITGRVSPII